MSETNVKGLSELNSFLQELPTRIERNIMVGAMRKGMNYIKPIAQSNVRSISGLLAKGLKVGANTRNGTVRSYLRATGPHGYVARWVEFGTAAHVIRGKQGGWLSFGSGFYRGVNHPGANPKAFMRPALDAGAQGAVIAVGNYIKDRLASKHGLDTADIDIEGLD